VSVIVLSLRRVFVGVSVKVVLTSLYDTVKFRNLTVSYDGTCAQVPRVSEVLRAEEAGVSEPGGADERTADAD
jgi:hypothetical protein